MSAINSPYREFLSLTLHLWIKEDLSFRITDSSLVLAYRSGYNASSVAKRFVNCCKMTLSAEVVYHLKAQQV